MHEPGLIGRGQRAALLAGLEHRQAVLGQRQVAAQQGQRRLADAAASDHQHAPGELRRIDPGIRHPGTLAKTRRFCSLDRGTAGRGGFRVRRMLDRHQGALDFPEAADDIPAGNHCSAHQRVARAFPVEAADEIHQRLHVRAQPVEDPLRLRRRA